MIWRVLSLIIGAAIIAANTYAVVETAEWKSWHAQAATAAGLIVGSAVVGLAWRSGRRLLSSVIFAALLCGEGYVLLVTAERVIAQRDAANAPYREASTRHRAAQEVVDAAVRAVPTSSARLVAADDALRRADTALATSAAEKSCAANCRALLEKQNDAARAEVEAARKAFEAEKAAAIVVVSSAKAALSKVPVPVRSDGLAERVGIAAWALDLVAAFLLAVGVNGVGAGLVAYGAHQREQSEPIPGALQVFLADAIIRKNDAKVSIRDLYHAYVEWCRGRRVPALEPGRFGDELQHVILRVGLSVGRDEAGAVTLDGLAFSDQPRLLLRS